MDGWMELPQRVAHLMKGSWWGEGDTEVTLIPQTGILLNLRICVGTLRYAIIPKKKNGNSVEIYILQFKVTLTFHIYTVCTVTKEGYLSAQGWNTPSS